MPLRTYWLLGRWYWLRNAATRASLQGQQWVVAVSTIEYLVFVVVCMYEVDVGP